MFGYASTRQLTESQSDGGVEEPLGAPQPLRPWRVAAALCVGALLAAAACAVAAGTGQGPSAVRPSAPGRRGAGALEVVSKAGSVVPPCSPVQPAGSGFSIEDATACAEKLKTDVMDAGEGLGGGLEPGVDPSIQGPFYVSDHEITVSFIVKSTDTIDPAIERLDQELKDAAKAVFGDIISDPFPGQASETINLQKTPSGATDELHVEVEFIVSSEEDAQKLWQACMNAGSADETITGALGVIQGASVMGVKCAKNALAW